MNGPKGNREVLWAASRPHRACPTTMDISYPIFISKMRFRHRDEDALMRAPWARYNTIPYYMIGCLRTAGFTEKLASTLDYVSRLGMVRKQRVEGRGKQSLPNQQA